MNKGNNYIYTNDNCLVFRDLISRLESDTVVFTFSSQMLLFLFFLSLYTATPPPGHSRQVGAASVSIRQKKLKYSKE